MSECFDCRYFKDDEWRLICMKMSVDFFTVLTTVIGCPYSEHKKGTESEEEDEEP